MADTPEGKVKRAIRLWLGTLPNTWYFMPVSNGMGVHGIPDLIVCYRGVFVALEVKAPGKAGTATPLQKMQIRHINMAMGYAIECDSLETVKALFADIDMTMKFRPQGQKI